MDNRNRFLLLDIVVVVIFASLAIVLSIVFMNEPDCSKPDYRGMSEHEIGLTKDNYEVSCV